MQLFEEPASASGPAPTGPLADRMRPRSLDEIVGQDHLLGAGRVEGGGARRQTFMVGDSWVDGVAAAAAGVPFIAYRMPAADLTRWKIDPVATLTDLGALPDWLSTAVAG